MRDDYQILRDRLDTLISRLFGQDTPGPNTDPTPHLRGRSSAPQNGQKKSLTQRGFVWHPPDRADRRRPFADATWRQPVVSLSSVTFGFRVLWSRRPLTYVGLACVRPVSGLGYLFGYHRNGAHRDAELRTLLDLDFLSALGGIRTPNLLIRRQDLLTFGQMLVGL
jgi:hypothetical protein